MDPEEFFKSMIISLFYLPEQVVFVYRDGHMSWLNFMPAK
jgi:hypothetical protein